MRLLPLVLLAATLPGPAGAHAILMDSEPAARTATTAGPATVRLRFNSRIDHDRSRITLRAGRTDTPLRTDPSSPPDMLVAPAMLAPGPYVIRWQVLAIDGHITRGDVPFTVEAR